MEDPRRQGCALASPTGSGHLISIALVWTLALGSGCSGEDPANVADGGVAGDAGLDAPAGETSAPAVGAPRIAISEIMYNPVLSNDDDNNHEFVELFNPGAEPVALAGWRIGGEIEFAFPPGSVIAPGQFVVVAKNRAKLLSVPKYNLAPIEAQVLGDYPKALANGGGELVLFDAVGAVVDHAVYDDVFPWATAADAFGAGDGWFSEAEWFTPQDPRRNFAAHRYLGHSLERVSYVAPAAEVANWVPSPLDGASPGRPNSVTGTPPVIVEALSVGPESNPAASVINPNEQVVVRAKLTAGSPIANLAVESYVEFTQGRRVPDAGVTRAVVPMTPGAAGYEAILPPSPPRTLVRYRIVGERTPGMPEVISPRPTDPVPHGHHVYFVGAAVGGKPHYEILVSEANWGEMWSNISPDGPVLGCPADYLDEPCPACMENLKWNERVPAVLVFAGQAYDVRTRYQGSLEGRAGAEDIGNWPDGLPRPSVGPLKAMSWSISFPRYRRFEGQSRIVLNRLYQSCPGFSHALAAALNEDPRGGRAPAPRVRRWARLFVNGGPYNYVMDLEPVGDEYLKRFHGDGKDPGEVYKVFSNGDDLGPYAPGFGQAIVASPHCPDIPIGVRYSKTYKRENYEWRSHDDIMALIIGMSAARDNGPAKWREFMIKNFDVEATLKYYAVQQWGTPWDDNGKNYNVYKLPARLVKPGQGPWTLTSWDVDRMFGVNYCKSNEDCAYSEASIYCDPNVPRCNRWKRGFIEALKPEYDAKLKELNETLFLPANVKAIVDQTLQLYDAQEAGSMSSMPVCDAVAEAQQMKLFADRRYLAVRRQLGY
jgi:CotH kinase protein/Lamin Tail Domain